MRIEITTNENGKTSTVTREFDMNNEGSLEDALNELGVLDEIRLIGEGENLVIDMRRMKDGGALEDMSMAMVIDPDEWADAEHDERPLLGVYTTDMDGKKCNDQKTPVERGACVTGIVVGSPAEVAGLKEGDVITAIDGKEVRDEGSLLDVLAEYEAEHSVKVTYYRSGKKQDVQAVLAERKEEHHWKSMDWSWNDDGEPFIWNSGPRAYLGVNGGEEVSDGEEGAVVAAVVEGSAAEKMGIEEDDRITAINGTRVLNFTTLAELVADMEPGTEVSVDVLRDGERLTLKGALGKRDEMTWAMPPIAPTPPVPPIPPVPPYRSEDRNAMRREMDQLRREMQHLREEMRGEVMREMHVEIGTFEVSKEERDLLKNKGVTAIDNALVLDDLSCFPNPSSGFFRLQFEVPERGDLIVDLHDASGERVYHETITGFKGRYERTLDLSDKSNGTYFLVITQGDKAQLRKLMKQ